VVELRGYKLKIVGGTRLPPTVNSAQSQPPLLLIPSMPGQRSALGVADQRHGMCRLSRPNRQLSRRANLAWPALNVRVAFTRHCQSFPRCRQVAD